MMEIKVIKGSTTKVKMIDMVDDSFGRVLGDFDVAVINDFWRASEVDCDGIVKSIKAWRSTQDAVGSNFDRLCMPRSYVRRDMNPSESVTSHTFDSYFINMADPGDPLTRIVRPAFSALSRVDRIINGPIREKTFTYGNSAKLSLRAQILHYPTGGGFFDWHRHSRLPQVYGLILNLSQPGRDYESGSTCFKLNGQHLSTNGIHDYGALMIFRYDLEHMVEQIEPSMGEPDWQRGRWSAVLPLLGAP